MLSLLFDADTVSKVFLHKFVGITSTWPLLHIKLKFWYNPQTDGWHRGRYLILFP